MLIEGKLQIDLHCQHDHIHTVAIHLSRPLQAVKIFNGKTVMQMLDTLPLLFHVCGIAQANAAVTASEQALMIQSNSNTKQARECLVWLETAREHLYRVMVDWSDRLGLAKNKTKILQLQQYLPDLKRALFLDTDPFRPGATVNVNRQIAQSVIQKLQQLLKDEVFHMPPDQWLKIEDESTMRDWQTVYNTAATRMLRRAAMIKQTKNRTATVSFLPILDEVQLNQRLDRADAEEFVAEPQWYGTPCETTALCRQQHHALIADLMKNSDKALYTRILARLVELANIPEKLERLLRQLPAAHRKQTSAASIKSTGIGIAQVEAARGRLVHRLDLKDGIIRRYQILAPTEWNFHPQGVAVQLLKTLKAADKTSLKQQADLLIDTIDPCVRYQMVLH